MIELELSASVLCFVIPLLFFFIINLSSIFSTLRSPNSSKIPKSYPIIGHLLALRANQDRRVQWLSEAVRSTPTATFVLHRPLGHSHVITGNPANVQHILKTNFHIYVKGRIARESLSEILRDGIFNTNGPSWKFQRQTASYEFNTKSLRKFVQTAVDTELSNRLIPILSDAVKNGTVLDLQDILQRFAFDNICKIAFGYDPGYLLPSLADTKLVVSFETAVQISSDRLNNSFHPLIWKMKKFLDIGSEKQLRIAVDEVRSFAKQIIREKKQQEFDGKKSSLESENDLLSRLLGSGHSNEDFVTDIIISFMLAGRDTTSAALVWFFWLVSKHPEVENEILKEIQETSESPVYEQVKEMAYTHASLSETMRLYPPVPIDSKEAMADDVLPDGTAVKRGMRVGYLPYAMGRLEKLWGADWAEFRPERFLQRHPAEGPRKWSYVAKDPYTYTVFQAGPRICLGKEMAYLQMKRLAASVLRRFRVVPVEEGVEPVFIFYLTSQMKGGFPVRIEARREKT
uniref:CYP94A43 n=1 Tax=Maesa lanceolata TaxID=992730 RepID=A0A0B4KZX6_MAELA|nr:CYP94A43 [Maesa lanceolata]